MRAYIALRQSLLPKMERLGAIHFDEDRGTVDLQEPASEIQNYLEADFEDEERGMAVFLGIGICGLALIGTCLWDIAFFAGIPDIFAGLIVSIAIILATVRQVAMEKG